MSSVGVGFWRAKGSDWQRRGVDGENGIPHPFPVPPHMCAAACCPVQEERYKKDMAEYVRAKRRAEKQAASKGGRHAGHRAMEGVKKKKGGKAGGGTNSKLKKPNKPSLAQPEEMDARMLSALITGIRRAFPYVAAEVGTACVSRQGGGWVCAGNGGVRDVLTAWLVAGLNIYQHVADVFWLGQHFGHLHHLLNPSA